jgi:hypothetical protein
LPFLLPTISICPEPYQNRSRISELGLQDNLWSIFQYNYNKSFEGWPITNSSTGDNIWETTTFGFWEMIQNVSMLSYHENFVLNSSFKLENENDWLYAKVSKI